MPARVIGNATIVVPEGANLGTKIPGAAGKAMGKEKRAAPLVFGHPLAGIGCKRLARG